jgi:hypothetical protein
MKRLSATLSLVLALAAAPAYATTLPFSISGSGQTGAGTLTFGPADSGGYDVTGIAGTLDGLPITGLIGGDPGIAGADSPSGYFTYDNILFTDQPLLVDLNGLLFGSNGFEVNLFSQNGEYILYRNSGENEVVSFDLPEPASIGVLAGGLAGLAMGRRLAARRR